MKYKLKLTDNNETFTRYKYVCCTWTGEPQIYEIKAKKENLVERELFGIKYIGFKEPCGCVQGCPSNCRSFALWLSNVEENIDD